VTILIAVERDFSVEISNEENDVLNFIIKCGNGILISPGYDIILSSIDVKPSRHLSEPIFNDLIDVNVFLKLRFGNQSPQSQAILGKLNVHYPLWDALSLLIQRVQPFANYENILPFLPKSENDLIDNWSILDDNNYINLILGLSELAILQIIRNTNNNIFSFEKSDIQCKSIIKLILLLNRSYYRTWSLGEMSRHTGMSRSVLSERFNIITGMSPMKYLQDIRLNRAKDLLASSNISIDRIANEVGYLTAPGLSRVFRREFGLSPKKYRKYYMIDSLKKFDYNFPIYPAFIFDNDLF
jgi:AraC-like DNA-binding protein